MPISPTPTVKDPIITELKRICETQLAIPTTFMEANLSEANFGLDQMPDIKFPVLIYVTSKGSSNEVGENGEILRTAKVYALLLNSTGGETLDYASADINAWIYQMYRLGQNLQYWINKSPISVDGGIDSWTNDNLYEKFDAHLFGQGLTFEWKISTGVTGYYNNPGQQI